MTENKGGPPRFCVKCGQTYEATDTIQRCEAPGKDGERLCRGDVHPQEAKHGCGKCRGTGWVRVNDPRFDQGDTRHSEQRKCPNGCGPKEEAR